MSITYRINKEKGYSLVLWEGAVTAGDFLAHVQRLCADPDWPAARRVHLTDLRFATLDHSLDDSVLQQGADLYGKCQDKLSNIKAAVVANEAFPRAVDFERMIARYGASVIVFNFPDIACTWLNLEPQSTEAELCQMRSQG